MNNQYPDNDVTYDLSRIEYAGFWIRVLSRLIDMAIFGILLLIGILVFYIELDITSLSQMTSGLILFIILFFLSYPFYFIFMNVRYGKTLGKMVTELQIRREEDLGPLTLGKAIGRFFALEFISNLVLNLGFIWAGWDPKKQTWHDKLAKTVVVYQESLVPIPPSPPPPPPRGPKEMHGKEFAEIIFIKGLMHDKHVTLSGKVILMGRELEQVHIPIKDPEKFVSRIQCEIYAVDEHLYRLRNRSKNRTTKLNGSIITSDMPLRNNDIISFGSHSLRIVFF
ncbi:MAG: RDD family protein [Ignavibacteriales bacterium]|nr:RDD family protein [Ignavibacteriales bacterium]